MFSNNSFLRLPLTRSPRLAAPLINLFLTRVSLATESDIEQARGSTAVTPNLPEHRPQSTEDACSDAGYELEAEGRHHSRQRASPVEGHQALGLTRWR